MDSKQVLVMRKFPNMRIGKYVAQGAHASLGALLSLSENQGDKLVIPLEDPFVRAWLIGKFTKITVYVETEKELIDIHAAAGLANLPRALIRDAGLTEFNGVPTLTAVGVGPADPEQINKITGHLKLF